MESVKSLRLYASIASSAAGVRMISASEQFGGRGVQSAYGNDAMAIAVAAKRRKFSLGSLKSGDRLLKAIKNDFRKNGEEIDYDKLRRDGYSKAMIARLKAL